MAVLALFLALALVGALAAFWREPALPRHNLLLTAAAAPQLGTLLGAPMPILLLLTCAGVATWCYANRRLAGVPLIAVGTLLNLLAMAAHGGLMPIHAATLAGLGGPGTALAGSKDIVVAATPLWALSDWIVLAESWWTIVVSPGDLIIVAGVAAWLVGSRATREDATNAAELALNS